MVIVYLVHLLCTPWYGDQVSMSNLAFKPVIQGILNKAGFCRQIPQISVLSMICPSWILEQPQFIRVISEDLFRLSFHHNAVVVSKD